MVNGRSRTSSPVAPDRRARRDRAPVGPSRKRVAKRTAIAASFAVGRDLDRSRPAIAHPAREVETRALPHARTSETRRPARGRARRRESRITRRSPALQPCDPTSGTNRTGATSVRLDRVALPLRHHELLLRRDRRPERADVRPRPAGRGAAAAPTARPRRRESRRTARTRASRRFRRPSAARRCARPRAESPRAPCCNSAGMRSIEKTCATRCASSTV